MFRQYAIESLRMKYFPLVWAAFRRHTTESLLTLGVITLAFTLVGTMVGLRAAYENALNENRLDRLLVRDRFCCTSLAIGVREQLTRIPGVAGSAIIQPLYGYHQEPSQTIGITMVDEATVSSLPELRLTADHWKQLAATPTGLFFSRTDAQKWHVKSGDAFFVSTPFPIREDGATVWRFTVLGVVDDPEPGTEWTPHVYGNFNYYDAARNPDRRGRVIFLLPIQNPGKARQTCQSIDRLYANSPTPTYCVPLREDARSIANSVITLRETSLGIAAAGIFMVLFLCANSAAESVRERLPEFAVLKTLGFEDRAVAMLVFLEAALPSVVGALAGTAIAAALGSFVSERAGQDFPGHVAPPISLLIVALALVAAVVIALISAVAPLRRLRTMDPATVLAGR
jgi:putative ABC transport system permease protein